MSGPPRYLLISLPQSISPSNDHDEAVTALQASVQADMGTTYNFAIPAFKISALDMLLNQADELAKLCQDCEAVFVKTADALSLVLGGDQNKLAQQKNVNDKPTDQYLQSFSWNKVKYRIDKPIAELMDSLKKEIAGIDSDVRGKIQQYNTTKNNLLAAQRKQTGNLATRSLASIVDPSALITDSEYLETHLIAVPKAQVREYTKSYESLCSMVVPRSSREIAADSEFSLQAVATFKKTSSEFVHKCREHRWTPRELRPDEMEGGGAAEAAEISRLEREERTLWGEALRLARTGYSEAAMTWVHALALRVFVETVLRYGLPAAFVAGLVRTTPRAAKKVKGTLDATYAYLGGNALGRDSKGRVTRDDAAVQSDMQAAGHADEYTPYVYYEFGMD